MQVIHGPSTKPSHLGGDNFGVGGHIQQVRIFLRSTKLADLPPPPHTHTHTCVHTHPLVNLNFFQTVRKCTDSSVSKISILSVDLNQHCPQSFVVQSCTNDNKRLFVFGSLPPGTEGEFSGSVSHQNNLVSCLVPRLHLKSATKSYVVSFSLFCRKYALLITELD